MTTDTALALLADDIKSLCGSVSGTCYLGEKREQELADTVYKRITALLDSGGWMPIETAPKDGTRIALLSEHKNIWRECSWVKMTRVPDRWESFAVGRVPFNPIAWHPDPLPPLPKGETK